LTDIDLQKTLELFFRDEHLNDFKCEKCNSVEEVCIQRKFLKLPRVLILHLKRYQYKEIKEAKIENEQDDEIEETDENSLPTNEVSKSRYSKL
jgi:uncharacterized UBP type Zn finger protein